MVFSAFFFLVLGMLSCFYSKKAVPYFFFFSLFFAFFGDVISLIGLAPIIAFWLIVSVWAEREIIRFDLLILIFGVGLLGHLLPGIQNIRMLDGEVVKEFCVPYTYYLNFDKGTLGLLLLSTLPLCKKWVDWKKALLSFLYFILGAVFLILILSTLLGYVRFQPLCPVFTPVWLIHNLFFVAIAEEVFFRGFLQRRLGAFMHKYLALLLASLLFGLMHFQGGITFVFLSFVAGLFYGGSYLYSGKIESAILTHFFLNLIHFLGFSYPALGQST